MAQVLGMVMMNWETLCEAFSSPLTQNGLELQERSGADGRKSALVLEPHSDSWIALFEAGEPEYISVTLNNGARFWEHEWSDEYQKVYARVYGQVVLGHFIGRGELRRGISGGQHYTVLVNGEQVNSKYFVSEAELAGIESGVQ